MGGGGKIKLRSTVLELEGWHIKGRVDHKNTDINSTVSYIYSNMAVLLQIILLGY